MGLTKWFPVVCIVISGLATGASIADPIEGVSITSVPDWVDVVESRRPVGDAAVLIHLKDTQIRLDTEQRERYFNVVAEAGTTVGVSDLAQVAVDFNPAFETLEWHRVNIHRGDEIRGQLELEKMDLLQREESLDEGRMVDGIKTALLVLDDLRVGDVVDIAYTIRGQNPIFGGRRSGAISFYSSVPLGRSRVRIIPDQDHEPRIQVLMPEALTKVAADTWEMLDSPATKTAVNTPGWYPEAPQVIYSEFASWDEVIAWAEPLYTFDWRPSGPLEQLVADWQGLEQEQAVLTALRWVQDEIRYFGIELAENSHRPSPPDETVSRRFGDCKDKSVLLIGILERLGVSARPALVSTVLESGIRDRISAPALFDHVIVMADVGEHTYWLDPTRTFQGGDLDTQAPADFKAALPLSGAYETPLDIQVPAAYQPGVVERQTITLGEDDQVTVHLERQHIGIMAESFRHAFSSDSEGLMIGYRDYFSANYPEAIKIDVALADDREQNTFEVTADLILDGFWKSAGSASVAMVHAFLINEFLPDLEIGRTAPVAIGGPYEVRQHVSLQIPGFAPGNVEPLNINSDVMAFSVTGGSEGDQVELDFSYIARSPHIDEKHLLAARRDLAQIKQNVSVTISTDTSGSSERLSRLKKLIRERSN